MLGKVKGNFSNKLMKIILYFTIYLMVVQNRNCFQWENFQNLCYIYICRMYVYKFMILEPLFSVLL